MVSARSVTVIVSPLDLQNKSILSPSGYKYGVRIRWKSPSSVQVNSSPRSSSVLGNDISGTFLTFRFIVNWLFPRVEQNWRRPRACPACRLGRATQLSEAAFGEHGGADGLKFLIQPFFDSTSYATLSCRRENCFFRSFQEYVRSTTSSKVWGPFSLTTQ